MRILAFLGALLLALPAWADEIWQPISNYSVTVSTLTAFPTGDTEAQTRMARLVCTVDCFVFAATATDAPAIAASNAVFLVGDEPVNMRVHGGRFFLVHAGSAGTLYITEMSR